MAGGTIQWITSFLNWLNNPGDREPEIRNAIRSAGFVYGREEMNEKLEGYLKDVQPGAGISVDATDPQHPIVSFAGGEGTVELSDIAATGTPSSGTYLRGDGTWQTPAGAGDMSQTVYDPTSVEADAFDRANHHGNMPAGNVSGLATVATTGSYNDLTDKPAAGGDVTGPAGATAGNFPALDATGKVLSDSGSKPSDFATAADGLLAQSAVQPAEIADMLETSDIGSLVQAYDADTAKTDEAQEWTETQRGKVIEVDSGTTITLDLDLGQVFRIKSPGLSHNATVQLSNAANHIGAKFTLTGYQNAGGNTLSYGSGLVYIGGAAAPAIPTGAAAKFRMDGDIVAFGEYHFTARGVGV